MSLLLTALKGLACLAPVVAIPTVITLQQDSSGSSTSSHVKGTYSPREEDGLWCRLVVSSTNGDISVIVCPRNKERNTEQTSFYLHKKGDDSVFSEIDSWNFDEDDYKLEITKTMGGPKETFNTSINTNWSDLNKKTLKNVCTINWKNNSGGPHKRMQCQDVVNTWLLSSWTVALPEHLKN